MQIAMFACQKGGADSLTGDGGRIGDDIAKSTQPVAIRTISVPTFLKTAFAGMDTRRASLRKSYMP
jgi:hypothetical protein